MMSRLLIVFALAFLVRLAVAEPRSNHYQPPTPQPPPRLTVEKDTTIKIEMPGAEAETKSFRKGTGFTYIHEKEGNHQLFLDNGNMLNFPKGNFFRSTLNAWAPVENGFLVFHNDAKGQIKSSIYITNLDLLLIAQELEETSSKQEIVAEMVKQDGEECLEGLKVGAKAVIDTVESLADGGKRLIDGKDLHGTFNYEETQAQCQARRTKQEELAARLQTMLSKKSPTLEKFPKEQWPAILTILLGQQQYALLKAEGGVPGDNTSKPSNIGKGVHTATAAAETAVALRLFKKALTKPVAPPTTRFGSAKLKAANLLRWGTGTVLLYDAGKRSVMVWGMDTDPTWSPVGSALLASDAAERMKNWITANGNGFVTDKQSHRITTDQFFQGLEEDPRKPEGIPQPPEADEEPVAVKPVKEVSALAQPKPLPREKNTPKKP